MASQEPTSFGGELFNNPVAFEEVLGLSACLLPQMPAATTLVCEARWSAMPVVFSMSERVCEDARERGWPTYGRDELLVLIEAVENDRAFLSDFQAWCELKVMDSIRRLRREDVMTGVFRLDKPKNWPFEKLLRFLSLGLVSVEVEKGEGQRC